MEEVNEIMTAQEQQRAIDWRILTEANKPLASMDIKGKDYIPVNERIKAFRFIYPRGQIITEIIGLEDGICTMKASVYDNEGKLLATGHAQEKEEASFINKTSYIENCETSCIGRALGMVGIGLDSSVASYEEVANAKLQQDGDVMSLDEWKAKQKQTTINGKQWKELQSMYSKEEIKEMQKELGITKGGDIPIEYFEKKKEEYDKKFKEEHPDKDFY